MSAEIFEFDGETRLDIPAERTLSRAIEDDLESAVVLGFDSEGELYFSSSIADGGSVMWLLRSAEYQLLKMAYDE